MTSTQNPDSIASRQDAPCDAATLIAQMRSARMNLGIREYIDLGDGIRAKVGRRSILTVKLNGKDLYDVEIGRIRSLNYRVIAQASDVYAEDLTETLIRLGDEAEI